MRTTQPGPMIGRPTAHRSMTCWLVLCLSTAIGASGCLPPDPDFGECNRDEDCAFGRCIQGACLASPLADAEVADGRVDVAPTLAPRLMCDNPVVPAREARAPCGEACMLDGFVQIEPGVFEMGSPADEVGRSSDRERSETQHPVTLTRGFWLKTTEVTVADWRALEHLMDPATTLQPAASCADGDCPAGGISWYAALGWCNARSVYEGLPPCYILEGCAGDVRNNSCERVIVDAPDQNPLNCVGYRLPTEAEWEYAARAGTTTAYFTGDPVGDGTEEPNLEAIAWFRDNADQRAHPVAGKLPNDWGLYDTSGNLFEWVWDSVGAYRPAPATDPRGSGASGVAVLRGGSYDYPPSYLRSASRNSYPRSGSTPVFGFRAARTRIVCGDGACGPLESPETCPGDCPLPGHAIVPAGVDVLGSPDDELGRQSPAEGPTWGEIPHHARLYRSFWLKQTEVTQAEWAAVADLMGGDDAPSAGPACPGCPVEHVTWYDALAWANAASRAEGLPQCYTLEDCQGRPGDGLICANVIVDTPDGDPIACEGFRLPNEAEWEYAARAGADTAWHHAPITNTAVDPALERIGWYVANAGGRPRIVGQKSGSCWGHYDMAGNVHEWVWDAPGEYRASEVESPIRAPNADVEERVIRGGAFESTAAQTRAAARAERPAASRDPRIGFRVARTIRWPVTLPAWRLGGRGPSGGYVFYDKGVFTNGWRYLEAADGDLRAPWGCAGVGLPDQPGAWIGSGRLATPAILRACDEAGIAADVADRLDDRGVDDWFLPSSQALVEMNRVLMQAGRGGFGADYYWSSRQIDRSHAQAWGFNPESGGYEIVAWHRAITASVRAIRAF